MDQTELSNALPMPPINALPQELFSHILYCCCEETSPGQDQYDLLSSITSVCRHWRDVAIASSELWTKIAFGQDSYIPHTPRFLERSASRLIDVHVNITSLSSFVHSKIFVSTIQPHLARLRMLKLIIHDEPEFGISENYPLILEALSSTLLPHLTHLLIHSHAFVHLNPPHALIQAPSLRWFNVHRLPTSSITAYPQLTMLIMHDFWPTWQGFHDVILTCSSLETLVLPSFDRRWPPHSLLQDYDPDDPASRISAPSLRSLAVGISENCGCILFLIDMPNLEYLEVSGKGSLSRHFTSLPKLTTLRLNDTLVVDEESFFRSLSQLRRLELINVYPDAQVVTSHPRGTKFPFPRLSSLAYVSQKEATFGTRDWLLSVARLGASPFTIELGGAAVQVLDFTEDYEMDALRKRNISIINAGIPGGLLDDEKDYPAPDYADDMSELDDFEDYDFWEEDEEEEFDHEEDEYDYFFNG